MNSIKLLYIEDDKEQRTGLFTGLQSLNFSVCAVKSGADGLKKISKQPFDVVLCDLNMPDLSGLDVLTRIKSEKPNLPVIILTANGSVDLAVQSLRLGAFDFLLKPLQISKVENTILQAVEKVKLRSELEQSQSHLQMLMETVPDLIYSIDAKGKFLSVNRAALSILGYSPAEMIGLSVFDIIHPDDLSLIRKSFDTAMKSGKSENRTLEFRMQTKSGETKYFEVNRRLIYEDGHVVRQDGIARDVSQRRKLEKTLHTYSSELEKKVTERTEELEYTTKQLAALNAVSNRFTLIYDENELLDETPHLLCHSLDFDRGSLFLLKDEELELRSYCMEKDPQELVDKFLTRVRDPEVAMPSPFFESIKENKTVFICDLNADDRWPRQPGQEVIRTKAVVIAPIKVNKQPIGLIVGNMQHHEREMDRQDVARFEMFVNMVGLALDNIRAYQFLETKVVEKTKELRNANRKLRIKAKQAEKQSYSLGKANVKLLAVQEALEKKNTEMQKLLDELTESEEKFRQLTENINEVFWISEAKTRKVLYISPAFDDFYGKPRKTAYDDIEIIFESIYPDDKKRIMKLFHEELTDSKEAEYRIIRSDSTVRWIRQRAFPVKNACGEIYRVCGISEDITERKLAEEALQKSLKDLEKTNIDLQQTQSQLVQSEKMASLGLLVAGIAHEINTPVGAINSMHDTLKRAITKIKKVWEKQSASDKSLSNYFRIIEDANRVIDTATERVIGIIKRLRSFARLDEAELKVANIHEGIEDTLTLIYHEIKHNITLVKNYGDIPPVSCYPGRLNQVFLNLLINAKQAINGAGTITITTGMKKNHIFIQFRDSGVGIPHEKVKQIFDPGFTTKGVGVGTGLGLSICYQIIEDHRGKIEVESEVGKGTTFTISLPMNLDELLENS